MQSQTMTSLLNVISERAADIQAVVIHLNDTYIVEERPDQKQPGFPRLIATVDFLRTHIREQCGEDRLLVVHSGDFLGPSRLGMLDKGKTITELLNRTGVDFCVLGNHELDHKVPALRQRLDEAEFRVLMNVTQAPDGIHTERFVCWPNNENPRVALTGIVGESAQKAFKAGWSFVGYQDQIRHFMENTRPNLFRIALTHCERDEDRRLRDAFYDSASEVPNNSVLILGGHDHDIDWHEYDQQPLIFKNLANLQTIRVLVLTRQEYQYQYEEDNGSVVTATDYTHGFVHYKLTYDDFEPAADQDTRWLSGVIAVLDSGTGNVELRDFAAESAAGFDVREDSIRSGPTAFGVMASECVRRQSQADVVLLSSGMFRADAILSPRLSREDLLDTFLFEIDIQNGKALVKASVAVLDGIESALVDRLLQAGLGKIGNGAYPQVVDQRANHSGTCRLAIARYALSDDGLDSCYLGAAANYWGCSTKDAESRLAALIVADVSVVDSMVAYLGQVEVPAIVQPSSSRDRVDQIIDALHAFMVSFDNAMETAGVTPAEYARRLQSYLGSDQGMVGDAVAGERDVVRGLIRTLAREGEVTQQESFAEIYVLNRQIKAHRNTYKGPYNYGYLFDLAAQGIGGWER